MTLLDTLSRWFGSQSPDKSIQNATYSDEVYESFGVGPSAASGVSVTATTAMRVSAVYACVQRIAGAIASLPLHTYERTAEGRKRADLSVWWLLNESPAGKNGRHSAAAHWESVAANILLRGDSFTWIRRDRRGDVSQLIPLPWSAVDVIRDPSAATEDALLYFVRDGNKSIGVEASDMLHFPGLGFDGVRSLSVIQWAARNAAGNALAMDEFAGRFFAGGAHPSIVLQTDGKMSADQIAKLQTAFANKYSGVENAHKLPLVLTEGLKADTLSLSASDAQLLEARRFQVVDIARAFGVPPHMIGETSAATSWGSGIEAMSRGFVTYTLQPHLIRIEQEINRKLWPNREKFFVEFNRDALLEGDSQAQAAYFRAALGGPGTGCGWMTVDEVRKIKNLEPMGGDAAELFDPREPVETPAEEPADDKAEGEPDENTKAQVAAARYAADVSREVAEINAKALREAPAPVINVAAPIVQVPPPVVNVAAAEAPVVNVAAPVINVAPAEVVANFEAVLPEQPAPVVNITNEAPEVRVQLPNRITTTTINRDAKGNITSAEQLETDAE